MKNASVSRQQLGEFILTILPEPADFSLQNEGSIALLHPLTPRAVEWVNEHIGQNNGYQPMYPTVICEPRYIEPILHALIDAGLAVSA